MRAEICHRIKRNASSRFSQTARAVCALMLLLAACRKPPSDPNTTATETPAPPDLSRCTRIEVRVEPSPLEALRIPPPNEPNVLSIDEVRHIESLETMVTDDPAYIQALARNISMSSYDGPRQGGIAIIPVYYISGWRGEKRLVSFRIKGPVILTEDDQVFRRSPGLRGGVSLTPSLDPFKWRLRCARNLREFWRALGQETERNGAEQTIPQWCDVIAKRFKDDAFICPSAPKGRCHYAMNADYEPNAPGDMVLLFETQAGWNQHGGPELFTFDNHDPKGGCVLLNDGTVKFVRTEAELHALRWK